MAGEPIVLDLTTSEDAPIIDSLSNLAQPEAVKSVEALVAARMASLSRLRSRSSGGGRGHCFGTPSRSHEAIAVLGGRGSGKTTFLRSILSHLESEAASARTWNGRVVGLGLIDPTLLSAKDNLFLGIISRIQERVENLHFSGAVSAEDHKAWTAALLKLSMGLSALDDVGPNPLSHNGWEEAEFALEEGLATIRNNRGLEAAFGEFLEHSLALLGADAFAIGLDDIDIAFDRGWIVLETLRRYLTAERLIVFIAGDMELFSTLVRKRQWENLGAMPERFEPDRKREFERLVDRLEDQYLMKLLKPANRISLVPLHYYWTQPHKADGMFVVVGGNAADSTRPLAEFLEDILKKFFFVRRSEDRALYLNVLLSQPIRTVLAILRAGNSDTPDAAYHTIAQALSSPLRFLGLHPDRLRSLTGPDLGPSVVHPLVERGMVDRGLAMRPDLNDDFANLGIIGLAALFSDRMARNPYLALETFIKVGMTRDILTHDRQRNVSSYVNYARADCAVDALEVARRYTAYIRTRVDGGLDSSTVVRGNVALWVGGDRKTNLYSMYRAVNYSAIRSILGSAGLTVEGNDGDEKSKKSLFNFLSSANENTAAVAARFVRWERSASPFESLHRRLPADKSCLLALLAEVVDDGHRPTVVLSVNALIAVLAGVMRLGDESEIGRFLAMNSQTPTVATPEQGPRSRNGSDTVSATEVMRPSQLGVEELPGTMEVSALAQALTAWKDGFAADHYLSPLCLARIWTRYSHALAAIDNHVNWVQSCPDTGGADMEPWNRVYCGDILHQCIVAFLNSVLVEEALDRATEAVDFINRAWTPEDQPFLDNLEWLKSEEGCMDGSLFPTLWTCPLWGHYLDPMSPVFSWYMEQFEEHAEDSLSVRIRIGRQSLTFTNLHPLLNTLLLHRPAHLLYPPEEFDPEAAEDTT